MWLSTSLESGNYNESSGQWNLSINPKGEAGHLRGRHLIFATGAGCYTPVTPQLANREKFRGKIIHSVEYQDADSWKCLRSVVVGARDTGHDVASDIVSAGLSSVTIVQRSPTYEYCIA